MAIGFYDFKALHDEKFRTQVLDRYAEILENNAFVEGKYNDSFERRFSEMQKTKYCLLVANGTDALEIALQAQQIKAGDKVGIAAISFYATAECVVNIGATPIFIDVDPATGLMDPKSLERVLQEHQLKAIIPVHIYGLPAPIEDLEKICHPPGIKIVEDGAQAQGGYYENGKPIGSSENVTTYSFYPTKNLGAFGDAGAILTQSDHLKQNILMIRNHGRSPHGHALIGRNSRCDHLQAAVLDLKLDSIDRHNRARRQVASWYHRELEGLELQLVPKKYLELSSWHLYPIQLKSREQKYQLREYLQKREISSALFYEKAMPEEAPLEHFAGETKNAIDFAGRTLCLPMNPFIREDEVKAVSQAIRAFLTGLL